MSRLCYFACDSRLDEQPNPRIRQLSIREALEQGVELDLELLGDDADFDEPDAVLHVESEDDFLYPNIYCFDKEEYDDDIGTDKPYCAGLEWGAYDHGADEVLAYIGRQMERCEQLELWSVWLGTRDMPVRTQTSRCRLCDLTERRLRAFLENDADEQCMLIVR